MMNSIDHGGASFTNTTYTIDICQPLVPKKGTSSADRCPVGGTTVCNRAIHKTRFGGRHNTGCISNRWKLRRSWRETYGCEVDAPKRIQFE